MATAYDETMDEIKSILTDALNKDLANIITDMTVKMERERMTPVFEFITSWKYDDAPMWVRGGLKYFGFIPFNSKCSNQRQIHIDYEKIYDEYADDSSSSDDDDM